VRIRADQGIGIVNVRSAGLRHGVLIAFPILPCWKPALRQHAFGEIFQVDLVDDADAGRHDLERVERLHAPFEKLVALAIAPEFHLQIFLQRIHAAGEIHLHRWSTTRSTGTSGSMISDFCPTLNAERIAARSTSSGTPVKSCNTMRATMNGISSVRVSTGFHSPARAHLVR